MAECQDQVQDSRTIAKELRKLWEENLDDFLTDDHGIEIKLLIKTFGSFEKREVGVDELIFESKAVLNRTWEKLNVGKWMDVLEERKQVYAIASFIHIIGILHSNQSDVIEKSLEITDLGILLGCPFRSISLTKVADILSRNVKEKTIEAGLSCSSDFEIAGHISLENEIETVHCPSVERFYENYFVKNQPVKLTGCIDHWPALKLWQDFRYIVKKAGCRMVPVELGKHYADESYSQKLMKISDFINEFFEKDNEKIGYLAQHQLFDQVPELKKDIIEPDYCALTRNPDSSPGETEINAWFGPKGTVSPLHFDPKNNLLCQVVGTKKIILFPQSDAEYLYPHEGTLLFNTSRVDVENPDLNAFPKFKEAFKTECLLRPGEMLFIPPKYWHHVRALENSFSVSFWWE